MADEKLTTYKVYMCTPSDEPGITKISWENVVLERDVNVALASKDAIIKDLQSKLASVSTIQDKVGLLENRKFALESKDDENEQYIVFLENQIEILKDKIKTICDRTRLDYYQTIHEYPTVDPKFL